jgi:hypothetical protein
MVSRRSRPRRFLLPTLLAAVLVGEITGIALGRSLALPADSAPAAGPVAAAVATAARPATATADQVADVARAATSTLASLVRTHGAAVTNAAIGPASFAHAATAATGIASTGSASSGGSASSVSYRGTNHVWIPSLGINKGVQSFPCSRNRPPDAGVYRWGCAGRNNVYLMGHAWSTFKPLHDAYVGGRLKKGMKVVYADGGGRVHTYSVIWWKVVAPTTAASWAWASLSTPSMTLQTCVGSQSQYRLMVRLVQVG